MAIQNNISVETSRYGIEFNGAYYRVASATVNRALGGPIKFTVMIDLSGYATATPDNDTYQVDFKRYEANLDDVEAMSGTAFLDKCYAWVMAQDDMAGSTAV